MKREATATELPIVVIVFRALLASALSGWIETNDPEWEKLKAGKIPNSLIEGILSSSPPEVPFSTNSKRLESITKLSIPDLIFAAVRKTHHAPELKIGSMAELVKAAEQVVKNYGLAKTCRKAGILSRKVLREWLRNGETTNIQAVA